MDWYKKSAAEVLTALKATDIGLSSDQAADRLKQYGPNKLPESRPTSLLVIFLRQFQSPLIYMLMAAAIIVMFLEEWIDAGIIAFVLLFNAVMGTVQAGRAQNTLQALKKFTETNATVIREGKETIISDQEVVPGDILILQEGEKVAADARILNAHNILVDEAAFSGESIPVNKNEQAIDKDGLTAAEKKNMVFKGTNIVGGNGKAIVVDTGINTEIGKISKQIGDIKTEIPLQKNIENLSKIIIFTVLSISSIIFALGLITGKEVKEMFLLSVSVIISAVPEGLPIVITLVLATSVWRMSRRNVLVKKLQAVEALGEAKVIAVDKTGTLTKSELVVQKLYLSGGKEYFISGVGYDTEGEIYQEREKEKTNLKSGDDLVIRAGIIAGLCSDAKIFKRDGAWKISGDPTEAALSILAAKIGFSEDDLEKKFPQLAEISFDYKLKYKASLNKFPSDRNPFGQGEENVISVTGAPEVVLKLCDRIITEKGEEKITEKIQEGIIETFTKMSESALRVIAFAQKKTDKNSLTQEDIKDLVFAGMYGMKDALRPEVQEAMRKTRKAGVKVVMITGDHKITAEAIAKEAGIFKTGDKILTGDDLERMTDEELSKELPNVSVFARITPEQKLKIIQAYHLRKEIIAMTGDGVNDALSLVAADLGTAMGKSGTEVAKEASDLVLLDDNFGSIVSAIEEGRSIYKTLRKVLLYLFATSLGEILIITMAILAGLPLPILATQLIWLNLVTDGFLDVTLAMEPKEKDILKERYKRPSKWILNGWDLQRLILNGSVMATVSLFVFIHFLHNYSYEHALSVTLTTLASFQWFKAWICRSDYLSVFQMNPFSNKYLLGATAVVISLQLFALENPFMQGILRLTPLTWKEWIFVISVCLIGVFIDEIIKMIYRKFERKKHLIEVTA